MRGYLEELGPVSEIISLSDRRWKTELEVKLENDTIWLSQNRC